MRKYILFLILIVFVFLAEIKSQNIDSLIRSLDNETNDTIEINTYIRITKYLNTKEPIKSLPYAIKLCKLAEKVEIDKFLINAYNQLGITYYFLGNTKNATEFFLRTLKLTEKNNDSLGISKALNNIGLAYLEEKAYTNALQYFEQSLEVKLKKKDYPSLLNSYMNIGLVYGSLNEYNKALKNYFLGLDAWKKLNRPKDEDYAGIICEIAIIYQKLDSLKMAEQVLNESIILFKKSKNVYQVSNALLHLAMINRKKGNYNIAQNYLNEAIKHIEESGANSILPDCYLEFSKNEEAKGNTKKAFEYYKKYHLLEDSTNNQNILKEMNQMQEIYLIEKQEAETLVLKNEIELGIEKLTKNRIITAGAIFLLIIVIAISIYENRNIKRWKRANKQLKEQQNVIGTSYKELQQQKYELEKMAILLNQLNADKDRFMTILGHDLRSPFNSLLGLSNLLLKKFRNYDNDKIEKQLQIIHQVSQNAYNLLEDLLLWSKSQLGNLPYEPKRIVFFDICNEIMNSLSILAEAKRIRMKCYDPEETILYIDLNMFKTILRNLLSNAIKFTGEKGQIDVKTEVAQSEVTITVSDNGIGIAKTDQEKLWDISHSFSRKGTSNEEGTGLGLLLCKEFVDKHGGKIWVESELGKGSDFKFTIPQRNDL